MLGYRYELAKFEIDGWVREAKEGRLAHLAAETRRADSQPDSSVARLTQAMKPAAARHARAPLHLGHLPR